MSSLDLDSGKIFDSHKILGIIKFRCLQSELNSTIESNKQKYYSRVSKKLVDPMTSMKSYWLNLNMFLNNKKIPCIPPLSHQNKYVTDFKVKAEIFNSFFAKPCSLVNNFPRHF